MKYPKNELFEKLADIEHQRWTDWQKYMHSKCVKIIDASTCSETGINVERLREVIIPAELYERWERQIATKYEDLSEQEKDSDRDQVIRYFNIVFEKIEKSLPDKMGFDELKILTKHINAKTEKDRISLANERVYGFNFALYMVKAVLNDLKNN